MDPCLQAERICCADRCEATRPGGRTVILEEDPDFFELMKPDLGDCEIYLVQYSTTVAQGQTLLGGQASDARWQILVCGTESSGLRCE
jgi:hypothetical protein